MKTLLKKVEGASTKRNELMHSPYVVRDLADEKDPGLGRVMVKSKKKKRTMVVEDKGCLRDFVYELQDITNLSGSAMLTFIDLDLIFPNNSDDSE